MLVSYKWLQELVDLDVTALELSDKMSVTGIEVEGVTSPAAGLKKIVVGEVISCEKVPETHLYRCQVNVGEDELRQIVCGAPNIKAGIKVIVALPGARIADNYKIKKGKIRGMESLGMICSLQELGISASVVPKAYADGIYYLPDDAVPGSSVFPYLDWDDEIIELAITPNRADALSMRGVAHEVAAIYNKKVHFPEKRLIETEKKAADLIEVAIESDKVLSYQARVVENVTVAPSPQWLQNLLMNAGIRPINNIVDITNYILLYFGQPMHAFDLDTFKGREIVARDARDGESLVTLDGQKRELVSDDIVISVADQAVALGGVMGGLSTEINQQSKRLVLEAAVFDAGAVRKTGSRLNLRSESSARFEKGVNYATVAEALDFAAAMLAEIAGGAVLKGRVEAGFLPTDTVAVSSSLGYVNVRLGTELTFRDIEAIFDQLGFAVSGGAEAFTVAVPRRRWDIRIQADLVEEIARIYGYDKLPTTLPETAGTLGELTQVQKLRRKVRTIAEGAGLSEIISYALTRPDKALEFTVQPSQLTELMWPMSTERSALRQNMVAGMLDTIAYNAARKNTDIAVYEIGKIFEQTGSPKEELPKEVDRFAVAVSGLVAQKDFQTPTLPVDFFYIKGIIETLADKLGLHFDFAASKALSSMHPGRTALILLDGQTIGYLGQVHPRTAKAYEIPETYVAELSLNALSAKIQPAKVFQEIVKFPSVSRDIALLLDKTVSHKEVLETIASANIKYLSAVKLFDVYEGNHIEKDKKSMAYNLTFQNPAANLTDDDVAKYMEKITGALTERIGAEIR
ncbi:phenylalanine--tRNA ligase subunit beta [Streptococcus pantholopis]|uniref:Phenylalanine--tRNA ligase beta subunit n=1 Tax=Streptococcus pantholopis TaxID=1811193 RepID=A0A172Q883_9STRE|nr:phenylalanine--tRNA ligase subunit beta [Streptococcus pantholopis]AND79605.1 phenylalanine--tRNA ligase subunit beta [Streptococcus pantholopis]